MLVLAATLASASMVATAAQPELTGKQKKEMAAAVKQNMKGKGLQPRTMAQANLTKVKHVGSGATGMSIATELWSTLAVQYDAQGNAHLVETDGSAPAATTVEGLPNE